MRFHNISVLYSGILLLQQCLCICPLYPFTIFLNIILDMRVCVKESLRPLQISQTIKLLRQNKWRIKSWYVVKWLSPASHCGQFRFMPQQNYKLLHVMGFQDHSRTLKATHVKSTIANGLLNYPGECRTQLLLSVTAKIASV